MRKTVVMLAGALALCAQGAWYWPFGTDEDSTNAPPRLHRLLEPANDYIELAQDASLNGDTAKALGNLNNGLTNTGLSCANANNGLTNANWNIGGRSSLTSAMRARIP